MAAPVFRSSPSPRQLARALGRHPRRVVGTSANHLLRPVFEAAVYVGLRRQFVVALARVAEAERDLDRLGAERPLDLGNGTLAAQALARRHYRTASRMLARGAGPGRGA